ncbi:sensor histidine kinase [Mycetocola reblochoni]|uniref:histidine kinase n=2 Tax=Mycetocola reblochoni TaxID=331618 RepID=A0A1R4JAC1_9MICO|nr:ATP-binding protein [Mycetocola reblochoni]RLP70050.1 GHKL domain-containing protein [Mycetocola reblochoni]SJN28929.1 Signal transduction histidine kinase CitA regulating citrate metabolism [Mycetocola reblochoni REB411]
MSEHTPVLRVAGRLLPLVQVVIVVVCVAVTVAVAAAVHAAQLRQGIGERVRAVALSLAELPEVGEVLAGAVDDGVDERSTARLQPVADLVASAAGVDYVVVTDDDGVRFTHPTPRLRGEPVSTDPAEVLGGAEFLGTETGTLGPSYRAKVPVLVDGTVVGTASVGILESRISAEAAAALGGVLPWALGAGLVGTAMSALLGARVDVRLRAAAVQGIELEHTRAREAELAAQTHEFRNRLHVIAGMVESGRSREALGFIGEVVPVVPGGSPAVVGDARVDALLRALAAEASAVGVRLAVSGAADPAAVDVDVITVLGNLADNAIEACAGGDGPREVRVRLDVDRSRVEIEVQDSGHGIDPALAPDVFARGVTTHEPDGGGAARGEGLATVAEICRHRGGAAELGCLPSGGTRFRASWPLRRPAVAGGRDG